MHKAALSLERNIVDRVTTADNTAPEARVEKMFEYGYRKSNYGPDELMPESRIIAFTAHATKLYTEAAYKPTDILLFGPEPGDVHDPTEIIFGQHVSEQVRLTIRPSLRSLNLTNFSSIAIYEAWRQLGFKGGQ